MPRAVWETVLKHGERRRWPIQCKPPSLEVATTARGASCSERLGLTPIGELL